MSPVGGGRETGGERVPAANLSDASRRRQTWRSWRGLLLRPPRGERIGSRGMRRHAGMRHAIGSEERAQRIRSDAAQPGDHALDARQLRGIAGDGLLRLPQEHERLAGASLARQSLLAALHALQQLHRFEPRPVLIRLLLQPGAIYLDDLAGAMLLAQHLDL